MHGAVLEEKRERDVQYSESTSRSDQHDCIHVHRPTITVRPSSWDMLVVSFYPAVIQRLNNWWRRKWKDDDAIEDGTTGSSPVCWNDASAISLSNYVLSPHTSLIPPPVTCTLLLPFPYHTHFCLSSSSFHSLPYSCNIILTSSLENATSPPHLVQIHQRPCSWRLTFCAWHCLKIRRQFSNVL